MFIGTEDRTARATIRDEALRLFAEHGPSAVTIRDVAAAADVSPALVIRHYASKDGLREAVDDHVARVFETMLAQISTVEDADPFEQAALPSLAQVLMRQLPTDSPIPSYLGWMLVGGKDTGSALFARLYTASRQALTDMATAGQAAEGTDPAARAAFLLVNDLAVLMLRHRLTEVLDVDPLSTAGIRRWGTEVLTIYRSGLTGEVDD